MTATPREILDFWFDPANATHWFAGNVALDELLRRRFADTLARASDGQLQAWALEPEGWLALLLVLDQFPRNLHRDDRRAWQHDASAQRLALSGIARGDDRKLPALQRVFAYLPLEHAEDMGLQDLSVAAFEALLSEAAPDEQARFAEFLDYARRHRAVMARFGRFPHRNALLGRGSTPAERDYLSRPGAGF